MSERFFFLQSGSFIWDCKWAEMWSCDSFLSFQRRVDDKRTSGLVCLPPPLVFFTSCSLRTQTEQRIHLPRQPGTDKPHASLRSEVSALSPAAKFCVSQKSIMNHAWLRCCICVCVCVCVCEAPAVFTPAPSTGPPSLLLSAAQSSWGQTYLLSQVRTRGEVIWSALCGITLIHHAVSTDRCCTFSLSFIMRIGSHSELKNSLQFEAPVRDWGS